MKDNSITLRLAGPGDAVPLADLHFVCSAAQPGGFMHQLGRGWFVKYYEIILSDPTSVVLCAESGTDGLVGLASATLDSKKQLEAIRKGRLKLMLAIIPALVRKPGLIRALSLRNRSLSSRVLGEGFLVGSGARIAYWGWHPDHPTNGNSTRLLREMIRLMAHRGAATLQLEVDRNNKKVEVVHRLLGARIVGEFKTRDGRDRLVMQYDLSGRQR